MANASSLDTRRSLLWLLPILLLFVILAGWHSVVVPITQGEDELAHFRYIKFIAQTGRLPVDAAERQQAWYRSDWPPLYHLLVGAAVSPLDTAQPRLKDVGESPRRRLVGEIFYPRLIIYTEDAAWPWQDAVLAWHLGRFMSIAFATVALVFVYLTAFEFAQNWGTHVSASSQLPPARGRSQNFPPSGGEKTSAALPLPAGVFALAATALLAFTPRFLFTSAMLSDDSLFILLSAIFIWLLLRALRGQDGWLTYAALGLLLGLSIATKYSTGLLPLTLLPVLWYRSRQAGRRWTQALGRLAWSGLFLLLGAGWWFGWIIYHFNTVARDGWPAGLLSPLLATGPDVSMRRVFDFLGGGDFSGPLRPAAVAEGSFSGWWVYLFQTFWGVPVLEFDPLFPAAYLLVALFCLLALAGLIICWRRAAAAARLEVALLAFIVLLLLPFPILRFFLTYNILETGQGRHILYPAAQSIPILLTLGWLAFGEWANLRMCEWRKTSGQTKRATHNSQFTIHNSPFTIFALTPTLLLLVWSLFQLTYMARTYPQPLPVRTTTFEAAAIPQPLIHNFGDDIRLLGYDFQPDPDRAIINLTLWWEALNPVDENYRTRIQLVDDEGRPHFTWLSHPLDGRYPTRAWDAGDVIRDKLSLPLAAVPPHSYDIELTLIGEASPEPLAEPFDFIYFDLGQQQPIPNAATQGDWQYRLWLDDSPAHARQTVALSFQSLESRIQNPDFALIGPDEVPRPPATISDATAVWLVGNDWPGGDYSLRLPGGQTTGQPALSVISDARHFSLPPALAAQSGWTPVEANFGDQIELLGYALPERRAAPGGALPISLAWRSLAPVQPDALTFAVLLDGQQQPHGSIDRYPQGFYSPILWAEGEVVPDEFSLPVAADAPPGVYTIHLGLYEPQADGSLDYLPLLVDGQPTESTAVVLPPVKIGGPPPEVITQSPQPQIAISQTFGGQITLLGYDQESGNNNSPNSLHLTLYWQADSRPAADYTVFLHLRDAAGQTVAQKDQPPTAGRYPTGLWDAGEIIKDEISLSLAEVPPGQYTPVIGLYQLSSGARLSLADDPTATELSLQPVQVTGE